MKNITFAIIFITASNLSLSSISLPFVLASTLALGINQTGRDASNLYKFVQDSIAKTALYGVTTAIKGTKDAAESLYEGTCMATQKYFNKNTAFKHETPIDIKIKSTDMLLNPKLKIIDPNESWSSWGAEKLRKATGGYFTSPERKKGKWVKIDIEEKNPIAKKNEHGEVDIFYDAREKP